MRGTTMARRALFTIIGLLVAGCAASVAPTDTPTPAESSQASSAQVSPSQAEPTLSATCEPGDDGVTQPVPATANIFGAGRDKAPAPAGGGAGSLPPPRGAPARPTHLPLPRATRKSTPDN